MIEKFKQWVRPNLPTKRCPHRYCRQAHHIFLTLGVGLLAVILTDPIVLLYLVLLAVLTAPLGYLAWGRKGVLEREMEEVEQRELNEKDIAHLHRVDDGAHQGQHDPKRTVFPGGLVVHKGWSIAAICCDVYFILSVAAVLVVTMNQGVQRPETIVHPTELGGYISLAVGIATVWFEQYAHRKATSTRRRKRQWFGAFGTQGSEA